MLFVVTAIDKPDSLQLRMSAREAHFAYVQKTGIVRLGGPFLDASGNMCGSLMFIEAADRDAVTAWLANEPYTIAGLFASCEVRPWKATYNPNAVTL